MKKILYLTLCLIFSGLTNATAATNRFTATSFASGVLGYVDYDSSIFDGTPLQFIDNSNMLGINFIHPLNGFQITTIGPSMDPQGTPFGAYFDSTGILPIFLYGVGTLGGSGSSNDEVSPITGSTLILGSGSGATVFNDVAWSTSVVSPVAAVPEPEIYAMMGVGLALLGWVKRKKNIQTAA